LNRVFTDFTFQSYARLRHPDGFSDNVQLKPSYKHAVKTRWRAFLCSNINVMLEQQLINAFMKLTAKVGAGDLVREMIQQVDENGNPKAWSVLEMERAVHFINMHVENFGKAEATGIIQTLMRKFDIRPEELPKDEQLQPETTGVQGLQ
jgi:hypothetical protein